MSIERNGADGEREKRKRIYYEEIPKQFRCVNRTIPVFMHFFVC